MALWSTTSMPRQKHQAILVSGDCQLHWMWWELLCKENIAWRWVSGIRDQVSEYMLIHTHAASLCPTIGLLLVFIDQLQIILIPLLQRCHGLLCGLLCARNLRKTTILWIDYWAQCSPSDWSSHCCLATHWLRSRTSSRHVGRLWAIVTRSYSEGPLQERGQHISATCFIKLWQLQLYNANEQHHIFQLIRHACLFEYDRHSIAECRWLFESVNRLWCIVEQWFRMDELVDKCAMRSNLNVLNKCSREGCMLLMYVSHCISARVVLCPSGYSFYNGVSHHIISKWQSFHR